MPASDTSPRNRDHFTLSSPTLAQTQQGPDVYNSWHYNEPGQLVLNDFSLPVFHPQPPYLSTHENLPHENSSRNYLINYQDITTQPIYPSLPPSFEVVNSPNMVKVYRDIDNDYHVSAGPAQRPPEAGPSSMMRSEPSTMGGLDGDIDIVRHPGRDIHLSNHGTLEPASDFPHSDPTEPDGMCQWETIDHPMTDVAAAEESRPSSHPERRSRSRLNGVDRMKTGNTRKLKVSRSSSFALTPPLL